jgi:hypothetical protein
VAAARDAYRMSAKGLASKAETEGPGKPEAVAAASGADAQAASRKPCQCEHPFPWRNNPALAR